MCIAAPAHVIEIDRDDKLLIADFGGARQHAKIDLLPEVEVGDYVLIHAGYAIEKLSEWAEKKNEESNFKQSGCWLYAGSDKGMKDFN